MVFDAVHRHAMISPNVNACSRDPQHRIVSHSPSPPHSPQVESDTEGIMANGNSIDGWQRKPLLEHEHSTAPDGWQCQYGQVNGHTGVGVDCEVCYYSDKISLENGTSVASGGSNASNGSLGRNGLVKISVPPATREEPKFPAEKWKTFLSLLFLVCNWVLTTTSLAIVHERLPDRTVVPPLPDITFDLFPAQDWALGVSEVLIIVSVYTWQIVVFVHKHRYIILRRCFLITGLLYLMRSITMFVTQVPVASTTYYCSPKANSTSPAIIVQRSLQLLSGFGLSINGRHTYCGDYIYSGHTVILTLAYLFIKEYTPRRCWLLHWLSWATSVTGVLMVMISRGHYTVDVIIAYFVTTRVFWIYHTLANNHAMKVSNPNNYLSRLWWFFMFEYFERNVKGVVPRQYEWPLPWPRRLMKRDRNS